MAIYKLNEQKQQMTGSWTSKAERRYTRIIQALSNDPLDGPETALAAVASTLGITFGFPIGVLYQVGNDLDFFARLKTMTATQEGGKSKGEYRNWIVRLEYDSTAEQVPDNPLAKPTQVSSGAQIYQKAAVKDIYGNAIVNKANTPFEEATEIDDARWHVSMVRNEAYPLPAVQGQYVNAINSTPWYGGNAQQWKCMGIGTTGPHIENNVQFYTVTYEFQFRQETWKLKIENRGYRNVFGKEARYDTGREVTEPVYLDINGQFISSTGTPTGIVINWPQDSTQFISADFDVYQQADFNALNLP